MRIVTAKHNAEKAPEITKEESVIHSHVFEAGQLTGFYEAASWMDAKQGEVVTIHGKPLRMKDMGISIAVHLTLDEARKVARKVAAYEAKQTEKAATPVTASAPPIPSSIKPPTAIHPGDTLITPAF